MVLFGVCVYCFAVLVTVLAGLGFFLIMRFCVYRFNRFYVVLVLHLLVALLLCLIYFGCYDCFMFNCLVWCRLFVLG